MFFSHTFFHAHIPFITEQKNEEAQILASTEGKNILFIVVLSVQCLELFSFCTFGSWEILEAFKSFIF